MGDGDKLLARFREHDAYTVADAARQARCGGEIQSLRPQTHASVFVGYALTARIQIEQNASISTKEFGGWRLHDRTQPGDVAVLDAGAIPYTATGALAAANLKRRGAAASVVNARIRDVEEIEALELPIFSCGTGIRSIVGHGYVADVGEPVRIDGISIHTGDVLLGCRGGIVVVPRQRCEEVLEVADRLKTKDQLISNSMQRGASFELLWNEHKSG